MSADKLRLDDWLPLDTLLRDGVMQQAGNRLVLIAAKFQHQAGDAKNMRDAVRLGDPAQLRRTALRRTRRITGSADLKSPA